jgi:hypothetical protein
LRRTGSGKKFGGDAFVQIFQICDGGKRVQERRGEEDVLIDAEDGWSSKLSEVTAVIMCP